MKPFKSPLIDFVSKHRVALGLGLIMLLAVLFRFWQLHNLPPGLHPDEAANGLDAFRILEQKDWRPLYNTNGPREALFAFLQAIPVAILGNSVLALRIMPALLGSLAVLVTYLWAKSWFGPRVAFMAAFFMAVSPWAVTMSRDGFRAGLLPLVIPLTLWLYTLADRQRKIIWYLLAGVSLGAGLYSYLSFRIFPVGLAIFGLYLGFVRREALAKLVKPVIISLLAAAVVLIPLAIYGLRTPADITTRASDVSIFNAELNQGHIAKTFLKVSAKTLLMFNIRGDENFRHNLGPEPMLNFFVGIMFVLGIIICIARPKQPKYMILLILFSAMLLPVMFTAEGIPHALRAIGVIPFCFVLAGIGTSYLLESWFATFPINSAARSTGILAMVVLFTLTAYQGYRQYFVAWAASPQTHEAYSEDVVAMAKYINASSARAKYAVIDEYSNKTLSFLTHNKSNYTRLEKPDPSAVTKDPGVILMRPEENLVPWKKQFPKGKASKYFSGFDDRELFIIFEAK